jgi:hypothetical protein
MRKDGAPGAALYSCTSTNVWTAVGSKPQTPSLSPVFSSSSFASRSLAGPPSPTILATVPITLGQSSGSKGDWYVCSVIEATVEGTVAGSKPVGVTFGIGATQAGAGTAFRMYSRPQRNEKNPSFDDTVVSDWSVGLGEATGDGTQNATSDGRYCNTYANRATLSFTGYAVPSLGTTPNTVFTSGRIEIEATPQ